MFEPVHGSAPKYAGKNVANPIAAIMSAKMMLEYLGEMKYAEMIEKAVMKAIEENKVTKDFGGSLGTKEAGDAVSTNIKKR